MSNCGHSWAFLMIRGNPTCVSIIFCECDSPKIYNGRFVCFLLTSFYTPKRLRKKFMLNIPIPIRNRHAMLTNSYSPFTMKEKA